MQSDKKSKYDINLDEIDGFWTEKLWDSIQTKIYEATGTAVYVQVSEELYYAMNIHPTKIILKDELYDCKYRF